MASVERASEHPLAMAIVMAAQERKLALSPVTDFDSPLGKGVVGTVGGLAVVSGSAKFLGEHAIDTAPLAAVAEAQRKKAATVIFVGVGGKLAGFVAVADPIKSSTPQALQGLKSAGVHVVMLTGDGKTTAEAVGRELGIDEVVAEVLPEDKAAVVKRLQAQGRVVAMAGDGVNDAPALVQATVGVALKRQAHALPQLSLACRRKLASLGSRQSLGLALSRNRHARHPRRQDLIQTFTAG